MNRKLGGTQRRSGYCGKEMAFPCRESNSRSSLIRHVCYLLHHSKSYRRPVTHLLKMGIWFSRLFVSPLSPLHLNDTDTAHACGVGMLMLMSAETFRVKCSLMLYDPNGNWSGWTSLQISGNIPAGPLYFVISSGLHIQNSVNKHSAGIPSCLNTELFRQIFKICSARFSEWTYCEISL